MGKIFDLDNPLMRGLSRLADVMWLNILTMLLCIPVITAGASLTAMHYVLIKMVRNEDAYITKSFFKSFKLNFKQATITWLIMLLVIIILAADFMIIKNSGDSFPKALKVLIGAITFFLYMVSLYVFPLLARFDNSIKTTLKNAILLAIVGFPRTVAMIACTLIPFALLYLFNIKIIPILVLFGIAGPAYLCALFYNKLFLKLEPEQITEEETEEEELSRAIKQLDEDEKKAASEEISASEKDSSEGKK